MTSIQTVRRSIKKVLYPWCASFGFLGMVASSFYFFAVEGEVYLLLLGFSILAMGLCFGLDQLFLRYPFMVSKRGKNNILAGAFCLMFVSMAAAFHFMGRNVVSLITMLAAIYIVACRHSIFRNSELTREEISERCDG